MRQPSQPATETTTPGGPTVDKCSLCKTWFLTDSVADLWRRLHAHEFDEHGRIHPTRADHRHTNDR